MFDFHQPYTQMLAVYHKLWGTYRCLITSNLILECRLFTMACEVLPHVWTSSTSYLKQLLEKNFWDDSQCFTSLNCKHECNLLTTTYDILMRRMLCMLWDTYEMFDFPNLILECQLLSISYEVIFNLLPRSTLYLNARSWPQHMRYCTSQCLTFIYFILEATAWTKLLRWFPMFHLPQLYLWMQSLDHNKWNSYWCLTSLNFILECRLLSISYDVLFNLLPCSTLYLNASSRPQVMMYLTMFHLPQTATEMQAIDHKLRGFSHLLPRSTMYFNASSRARAVRRLRQQVQLW